MAQRRASDVATMVMTVGFMGGHTAGVGDGSGMKYRVGLDGKQRKKRGPLVRVTDVSRLNKFKLRNRQFIAGFGV